MPTKAAHIREFFPQTHIPRMQNSTFMDQELLLKINSFLEKTAENNESTEFDASDDYLVAAIIKLVKEKGKTSVVEDFETPFVHPMITIQKWVEELKLIVRETLAENIGADQSKPSKIA